MNTPLSNCESEANTHYVNTQATYHEAAHESVSLHDETLSATADLTYEVSDTYISA